MLPQRGKIWEEKRQGKPHLAGRQEESKERRGWRGDPQGEHSSKWRERCWKNLKKRRQSGWHKNISPQKKRRYAKVADQFLIY